ncbi:FAD/NAD(P)-dependent oxidoreductase [Pollutimonas bauzanensis]|uniref:FAD/NAD(P)-dependent oxidoreductase n=1 Tax=Pollutimonas bauzanensis TaxID=658167 RepID=UPI001FEC2FD4|nr:NAD(P)/FAD-dependent oxidoreductase [Pollutimonas bauzanensis]
MVIGAGPAGIAAATQAAQLGIDTLLLDEQVAPGGQIYRSITATPVVQRQILGEDYWHGAPLVDAFQRSSARYQAGATVWAIVPKTPDRQQYEVAFSIAGKAQRLHARHILLATGAHERPFPVPGWTLPGVMTAGAAQILLKSAAAVPGGHTILAGCGPLLYLIAWQYLNAGVKIDALLDTTPKGRMRAALPHAWGFLRSPYLNKGLRLLRTVKSAIPIVKRVSLLEALGENKIESLRYAADGVAHTIKADHLLLHQGVVPNINLSSALGIEHDWNNAMACWEPRVDGWGATMLRGIGVAGDGAGIAGALAAEYRGRIAALQVAMALGRIDMHERDRLAVPHQRALARAVQGRAFFDALYMAPVGFRRPRGEVIVCRCEEITARQVRETVALGCQGPNQMKAFLRCGMGPCQGRFCSLTVTELIADERGCDPSEIGSYRIRFPTKPVTVGELASLPQTEASQRAVIRFKSSNG